MEFPPKAPLPAFDMSRLPLELRLGPSRTIMDTSHWVWTFYLLLGHEDKIEDEHVKAEFFRVKALISMHIDLK